MLTNSILNDIKMLCGVPEDVVDFDGTLILHCNTVFATLTQLGLGPKDGYFITSETNTWKELIGDGNLQNVKSYMYLRVKLLFDPPANATLIASIKEQMSELEWRIRFELENNTV